MSFFGLNEIFKQIFSISTESQEFKRIRKAGVHTFKVIGVLLLGILACVVLILPLERAVSTQNEQWFWLYIPIILNIIFVLCYIFTEPKE